MLTKFRYTDRIEPALVTLHLYATSDGPRATVSGPPIGQPGQVILWIGKPLGEAFGLAIRMANERDVSVVVAGDAALWDEEWGDLERDRTAVVYTFPSI